jgi:hypothetical protein
MVRIKKARPFIGLQRLRLEMTADVLQEGTEDLMQRHFLTKMKISNHWLKSLLTTCTLVWKNR